MKHDEVPVELVHATAELGLGLFEIPKEISFILITTTAQAEQVRQLNAQKEAIDKEISALSREAQERGLEALVEYCVSLCGGGFRWKSKC
ncbi:hypothetical protein GSS88_06040 [Corynebacterium sp. 3HC-13]|uniref:hypothetical protein n=1 Tax=Corynebacterium poyangense TaxID=2684405 RepID=UPI001CCFB3A5|nr:hypothetical protein [Corynebacterium poyangense]MBZ8177358.1 hypothetical protein [Corynebacterium poyangense]